MSAPTNLQCNHTQNGLTAAWDSGSVGNSCAEDSLNYSVTVIDESNGMVVFLSLVSIEQNRLDIIGNKSNQNYKISIQLQVSHCSNESEPMFSTCESLDDSKPSTYYTIALYVYLIYILL